MPTGKAGKSVFGDATFPQLSVSRQAGNEHFRQRARSACAFPSWVAFQPDGKAMPYELPRDIRELVDSSLQSCRNAESALTLATFIARFWSCPNKLGAPFYLDRRALAPVDALGLTEAR